MIRTLILSFCLTFLIVPATQATGINFSSGTWQEMLTLAEEQQKLIFVEAYADWCNICKSLERNTFRNEEVGAYYNENFISYRYDMEKGEGVSFSERYSVNGYPTLLFINYRGEVVHREEGYMAPPRLLAAGREALRPEANQTLLELQYDAGSSDPMVLYNYALNLKHAERNYQEAAQRYFDTQDTKALIDQQNWEAIQEFTTDLNSREFQYLLDKQKKFIRKYGLQPVADKIYSVLKQNVVRAAITRNRTLLQTVLELARTELKDKGQTASQLLMVYAEAARDWQDYAYKTMEHFENFTVYRATELNHAARNFYDHVDGQEFLEAAIEWSRQSIAIDNSYIYNETYALLLAKSGDREAAKTQALKAWQMGRMNDDIDTTLIRKLLRELGSSVD